jgi:hypothetical protein
MSTDALTMVWRWANWNSTYTTPGDPTRDARATLALAHYLGATVRFHIATEITLSSSTSTASIPWTTFPIPDMRLTLQIMRGTDPAGAGVCRSYLTVETLDAPDGNVTATYQVSVTNPGVWAAEYSVLAEFIPACKFFGSWGPAGGSAVNVNGHDVIIDSLGGPWPTESIVTGTLFAVTGFFGTALSMRPVLTDPGGEEDIGIAPPFERGLIETRDGAQLIARRDVDADAWLDVWARTGPDADWGVVSGAVGDLANFGHGAALYGDKLNRVLQPFAQASSLSQAKQTSDFGATWSAYAQGGFLPTVAKPLTDAMLDTHDNLRLAVGLDWSGGADRVFAVYRPTPSTFTEVTVAANCRTAGDTDCLPHPHLYRRSDGRWVCGWFLPNDYVEYLSDDLIGAAWTEQAPTVDFTADTGRAYFTAFWRGRDGQQAVAGYHFGNEEFVVLTRGGEGLPWTGPYLSVSSSTAAAPYIYERADGRWEAGWLIGGTWTICRALWPGGSWSAV